MASSGGGSFEEKGDSPLISTRVEESASGGYLVRPGSKVGDISVAENEYREMVQVLFTTTVASEDENNPQLPVTSKFFSLEGCDEPSTALVTKRLMTNLFRGKARPTIKPTNIEVEAIKKIREAPYTIRTENNVNLLGCRWDQSKLIVHPLRSGVTLDTLLPVDIKRTIRIKDLRKSTEETMSCVQIQEPPVVDYDLSLLPEEKVLELMASGFIKTGENYFNEYMKRGLKGNYGGLDADLRKKLLELKTDAERVNFMKESCLVKTDGFNDLLQNMMLGEFVELLIDETVNTTGLKIMAYATATNMINVREPTNCLLFSTSCVGSVYMKAALGSTKRFKLVVDHVEYLAQIIIELTCVETRNRVSVLRLQMIGEVAVSQTGVVRLYSSLYRSTGVIESTTAEVIDIQDDVYMGFMSAELINFIDDNDDYTSSNASGLVPMMALSGIIPDDLADPATNICWQISLKSVVNNLCKLSKVFERNVDKNHFLFCMKISIVIAQELKTEVEVSKFISQFFLWARFVDKYSEEVYTDYKPESFSGDKGVTRNSSGLGAQCLWVASAMFDTAELCKIGYKYLPVIILYNALTAGECGAKLVSMGVWLANSLNLNTVREEEDDELVKVLNLMGVKWSNDWLNRLSALPSLGNKISMVVEVLNDGLENVIKAVNVTKCTKAEAATLVRLTIFERETGNDDDLGDLDDIINNVVLKVISKMKTNCEHGEISVEDYNMLTTELARDIEDNSEFQQLLNSEGTKYHEISDIILSNKSDVTRRRRPSDETGTRSDLVKERRKAMEKQLIRDFTNHSVRMSEKARATNYQLTEYGSSTLKDTMKLNETIVTSFLHRVGNVAGKDLNLLISSLSARGVEGASASLSADDVRLLSITNMETASSSSSDQATGSSILTISVMEGISFTVGFTKNLDLSKLNENISKLKKRKSKTSIKMGEVAMMKRFLLGHTSSDDVLSGQEGLELSLSEMSRTDIAKCYFASLADEMKLSFKLADRQEDSPVYPGIKRTVMILAVALPGCLSCLLIAVRRATDIAWDIVTYVNDGVDNMMCDEKEINEKRIFGMTNAYRFSARTLKLAVTSTALTYKVTLSAYFTVAEGIVGMAYHAAEKISENVYSMTERILFFWDTLMGYNRLSGVIRERQSDFERLVCDAITNETRHGDTSSDDEEATEIVGKLAKTVVVLTRPARVINSTIFNIAQWLMMTGRGTYKKITTALANTKEFIMTLFNSIVSSFEEKVKRTTRAARKVADAIKSMVIKKHSETEDQTLEEDNVVSDAAAEDVTEKKENDVNDAMQCGSVSSRPSGVILGSESRSVYTQGETSRAGEMRRVVTTGPLMHVQGVSFFETNENGVIGLGAGYAVNDRNREERGANYDYVYRLIETRENRLARFARLAVTRLAVATKIIAEEAYETLIDFFYLFTARGYPDRYVIYKLSSELEPYTAENERRAAIRRDCRNHVYMRFAYGVYNTGKKVVRALKWIAAAVNTVVIGPITAIGVLASEACALVKKAFDSMTYKKLADSMVKLGNAIRSLLFDEEKDNEKSDEEEKENVGEVKETHGKRDNNNNDEDRKEEPSKDGNASTDESINSAHGTDNERRNRETEDVIESRREECDGQNNQLSKNHGCYNSAHLVNNDSGDLDLKDSLGDQLRVGSIPLSGNIIYDVRDNARDNEYYYPRRARERSTLMSVNSGNEFSFQEDYEVVREMTIEEWLDESETRKKRRTDNAVGYGDDALSTYVNSGRFDPNWLNDMRHEQQTNKGKLKTIEPSKTRRTGEISCAATIVTSGTSDCLVVKTLNERLSLHLIGKTTEGTFKESLIFQGELNSSNLRTIRESMRVVDLIKGERHEANRIGLELNLLRGLARYANARILPVDEYLEGARQFKRRREMGFYLREELTATAKADADENSSMIPRRSVESTDKAASGEKTLVNIGTKEFMSYPEPMIMKAAGRLALIGSKFIAGAFGSKSAGELSTVTAARPIEEERTTTAQDTRNIVIAEEKRNDEQRGGVDINPPLDSKKKNILLEDCAIDHDVETAKQSKAAEGGLNAVMTGDTYAVSIINSITSYVAKVTLEKLKMTLYSPDVGSSSVKQVTSEENFPALGQLTSEDEQELSLRGHVGLAYLWPQMSDVLSIDVLCSEDKKAESFIDVCGKRRLLVHGDINQSASYAVKGEIDIVDAGEISVLCMPDSSESIVTCMSKRGRFVSKNLDEYVCKLTSVCDVTVGKSYKRVMRGKSCVVVKEGQDIEMLLVPKHLNTYGRELPDCDEVDGLDCLALTSSTAQWCMTPKQRLAWNEVDDENIKSSAVLGRKEFNTSSEYFSLVSVDAVDWRGKSGAPIVVRNGAFLGVMIMQIINGRSVDVLDGAGLVVCAKVCEQLRPVFLSKGCHISKCSCVKDSAKRSDVDESRLLSDGRKQSFEVVDSPRSALLNKCGSNEAMIGNNNNDSDNNNKDNENDETAVSKKQRVETVVDAENSEPKRIDNKSVFRRLIDFASGSDLNEGDKKGVEAEQTGALERIGEILASEKHGEVDAGASDELVVHNICEILYYSDSKRVDGLARIVLEFLRECMVKNYKPIIMCSTNTCSLVTMALLSSVKLRFERIRSLTELRRRISYVRPSKNMCAAVMSVEDVLTSLLSKEKMHVTEQSYKVKCLVLISDNDMIKTNSLAALKAVGCMLDKASVFFYDSKEVRGPAMGNSPPVSKNIAYETSKVNSYQNSGVFHKLTISNSVIEIAEIAGFDDGPNSTEISIIVISMCQLASDYQVIRSRLAKLLDVSSRSIMATSFSSMASKQLWEIIKTCKNVYLFTGTKATYANDVIINCNLEVAIASKEKEMFLNSYKIASLLTNDREKCEDTVMGCETMKEEHREAKGDRLWFVIDYKTSQTTTTMTSWEVLNKVNHTIIEDSTVVQQVSVIENRFKEINVDGEELKMMIEDTDLINDRLVDKKRSKKALSDAAVKVVDDCMSWIKWKWHSLTIGSLLMFRRIKMSVVSMISRTKTMFSAEMKKWFTKAKRTGKKILLSLISGKPGVSQTSSYFNSADNAEKESAMSRFAAKISRCLGLANMAMCVVGHGKKKYGDESRMDNAMMVLMISAGYETVSHHLQSGIKAAIDSALNFVAIATGISEAAFLLAGWKRMITLGGWKISSSGASTNRIISSSVNRTINRISEYADSIEVVQTGLLINDVVTNNLTATSFLNLYELGLSLYEIVRKLMLNLKLSRLFSNIRKGIEYKNDHPYSKQTNIDAVPCYELSTAAASVVLIGTTSVIAFNLAMRRVDTAVSSVAVINEKKHTYDMVEVYKQDRDLGSLLFRTANIGYGVFLVSKLNAVCMTIGVVSISLACLDIVTGSFSELGVSYSLSHMLVRIYTSRNAWRAAINGWSAWYGRKTIVTNGVNVIMITGRTEEDGVAYRAAEEKKKKIAKIMKEAQLKERLANGVMMDKTVDASEAYDNAKMIITGKRSVNDLNDKKIWDHEMGASDEIIDLDLIASRGTGSSDWSRKGTALTTVGQLTKHQCRFIGRTKKIVKHDREVTPDDFKEKQLSVLAINDSLWQGVVLDEDRKGWEAAGDSRYAVLLAIAERNDAPMKLDVDDECLLRMAELGIRMLDNMIPDYMKVKSQSIGMDWLTAVSTLNERATSGILSRMRTGQQVAAGYVPKYGGRCEVLKELMLDGNLPDESSIINVFAKRRVEKVKVSRLTGIECVITRTIQANEIDLKIASTNSFLMMDKMMKLTRCDNSLAIGLNFFFEYATDELNSSCRSMKLKTDSNIRRISLDHSSFDGSQRNWGIALCREMRKIANLRMMSADMREAKKNNELLDTIYDSLLIRLMLTTKGDIFGVTGQQMSGHATTSSDNSMKSSLYAQVSCELMNKKFSCQLVEGTLRAQGDDTKMDVKINSCEVNDDEIKESISAAMAKLGQNVKSEKIEVLKMGRSCSFLSNKTNLVVFEMISKKNNKRWFENHLIPYRPRRELISMIATTLKSSTTRTTFKTKKDISLLAAKAMSFLTMYAGDAIIARICITIIWICFKALTEFKSFSSKADIKVGRLPWFVAQSGIEGEFEIKIFDLLEMHGVVRNEISVFPTSWILDKMDPDFDLINVPSKLIDNAKRTFPAVREWMEKQLFEAIKVTPVAGSNRLVKVSIVNADECLTGIEGGLTLSITEGTVPYEPYNRLKRSIRSGFNYLSNLGIKKVYVVTEKNHIKREECRNLVSQIEKPSAESDLEGCFYSKEGIRIEGIQARLMMCKNYNVALVDDFKKARVLEVNPWKIIRVTSADKLNVVKMIELSADSMEPDFRGIVTTDIHVLNRMTKQSDVSRTLDEAYGGDVLGRLTKCKCGIEDYYYGLTRTIYLLRLK